MATNMVREEIDRINVVVTNPTTPTSGSPVRYGMLTGVALVDEGDGGNIATETTVDFGAREWKLSVKGIDDSGNSVVAVGDAIFYVDGDTPKLSKKSSGYFFGIANGAVLTGATTTIRVLHIPSPGAGTLGSGTVGSSNLAAGAVNTAALGDDQVTAGKLTDTLATGFLPLPLAAARIIAANDIAAKNAADGGVVSLDTDPTFKRVNAATDKKARLSWAASSVIPVQWDITYPPDLNDAVDVTVCFLAAMAGAVDTPTVAVAYFEGLGDANAGGASGAVTGTVITKYTRTITAANIGAYPNGASIEFVPAAHTTDALHIYAAWVEYARK